MKRSTAAIAFVLVSLSLASSGQAQTVFENGYLPAPDAYANLPGVKDPKTLQPKERYTCHSTTVNSGYPDGPYRDVFGNRGLPVQGYRCTGSAGVTATGTRVPTSKDWYPGINPPAVDSKTCPERSAPEPVWTWMFFQISLCLRSGSGS